MSIVDNLQARLDAALAPLQSRLEPLLDSLSPRDRMLLTGLSAFLLLLLVGGSGWWMTSTLSEMRSEIEARKSALAFIRTSITEFEASQEQLAKIEDELKKHGGTDFSAFMEKAAQSANIADQLDAVSPSSSTTLGSLEVKSYNVSLKKVSLSQLLDFLYEVETDGYPLKITDANIKGSGAAGSKTLNVKLEVAAYRLLDQEEEEG